MFDQKEADRVRDDLEPYVKMLRDKYSPEVVDVAIASVAITLCRQIEEEDPDNADFAIRLRLALEGALCSLDPEIREFALEGAQEVVIRRRDKATKN